VRRFAACVAAAVVALAAPAYPAVDSLLVFDTRDGAPAASVTLSGSAADLP
jgi:hypothetical protein